MVFFAWALVLALAQPDVPEPEGIALMQAVTHYPVSGASARELASEMMTSGPVDPVTGRRLFGYTKYDIRWQYSTRRDSAGLCAVDAYDVELDIRIDMPGWSPVRRAARRLTAQWETFYARLLDHELGHRNIAVATATAVRGVFAGMPPMPCPEVDGWIRSQARFVMSEGARAQRSYDRETEHGKKQGAIWMY
jgi:predicted secreted Zn-dependent protease